MYVYLLNVTKPKYTEQLRGMFPSLSQNNELISNQITLFILYYISPRSVNLLKSLTSLLEVPNIFYHAVSFKLINFSFQVFLFLF